MLNAQQINHLALKTYFLLPTSYFLLLTSYFLLLTSYFLLPTSYFLLITYHLPVAMMGGNEGVSARR